MQGVGIIGRREPVLAPDVPLLADTVEVLVKTVGHDCVHANQVVVRLEAAGRDIPLEMED